MGPWEEVFTAFKNRDVFEELHGCIYASVKTSTRLYKYSFF
jgi:hypothetical protein